MSGHNHEVSVEMTQLLQSMTAMDIVRDWEVVAEPFGQVIVHFTSVLGTREKLTAEEMRGYSKGMGTAFRFFTEPGAGETRLGT